MDNCSTWQIILSVLTLVVLAVQAFIFFEQKEIMDKQRELSEQNALLIKQSQGNAMLVEIYKGFFENEKYKQVFIYFEKKGGKNISLEKLYLRSYGGFRNGFALDDTGVPNASKDYGIPISEFLDDYLGWFEVLNHAITSKIIEEATANKLFSYYLKESMNTRAVKEYLAGDHILWQDLKELCEKFKIEFPRDEKP